MSPASFLSGEVFGCVIGERQPDICAERSEMTTNGNSDKERMILAFQERFLTDRAEGEVRPLAHYLAIWPDVESAIAREYLLLDADKHETMAEGRGSGSPQVDRVGPYTLEQLIGRGGQGQVYRAVDTRLNRIVALKILTNLGPGAETQIKRFRREAQVASRIDHPGICAVHDAGIDGGVPYIAMRFVEGQTLAQRINSARSLGRADTETCFVSFDDDAPTGIGEVAETQPQQLASPNSPHSPNRESASAITRRQIDALIEVFEKTAIALHAAHEAGIVHRDIKPGNIMVSRSGEPVILDFGLAHDDVSDEHSLTRTGDVFGTPTYMSPEQIAGAHIRIDRRSDIYSLGVSLYECLTLRPAFEAPTRQVLYQSILMKEATDPRSFNRDIPTDLKVVLETAMAKDRDKRYQTAAAFAADLRAILRTEPIAARPIGVAGRVLRWAKRSPAKAALAAAMIIGLPLVAALGGFIMAHMPQLEAQKRADRFEKIESLIERGFFELHHGDVATGLAQFTEALTLDPQSPEALVGTVLGENKLKNFERARAATARAAGILEESAIRGLEAAILRSSGRTDEAVRALATLPPPKSAVGHFVVAGIEMTRAHELVNEAERPPAYLRVAESLRKAVLASPRPRRVYYYELSHASGHAGKAARPTEVVDAIEALWPESALSTNVCGRALLDVDSERSVRLLERSLQLKPGQAEVESWLCVALAACGRRQDALRNLEAIIAKNPWDASALNNIAIVKRELGDMAGAEAAYIELQKRHPTNVAGLIGVGLMHRQNGRPNEAIELFRKARTLEPNSVIALSNLGIALLDVQNVEEATEVLESAAKIMDTDVTIQMNLATCYLTGGRLDLARKSVDRAIEVDPKNPAVHVAEGQWLSAANDAEGAVKAHQRAIDLDAEDPASRFGIANALMMLDRGGLALKQLCIGHTLVQKLGNPQKAPTADWIRQTAAGEARRLKEKGDVDGARAILNEALATLKDDDFLLDVMDQL